MSRCPFAIWQPVKYDAGSYTGGPFRIVHHTTEGNTAKGNLAVFAKKHAPHFLVDHTGIWQLIDTLRAAPTMRNNENPPETNRLSAIQIEIVGFAGKPKNRATLANVAVLCRWIEAEHGVPRVWPNGYPVPAVEGKDSNKHNRDAHTWSTQGGHYGHEHVPENIHWDPAYTREEADLVVPPPLEAEERVA